MKTDDKIPMAKTNATHTGQVLTLPPIPRLELSTINAVRVEMARLYREAKAGRIAPADASRLAFILGQVGKLIEVGSLEARLNALENDL